MQLPLKDDDFEKNVKPLADSLSLLFGKPSSFYHIISEWHEQIKTGICLLHVI